MPRPKSPSKLTEVVIMSVLGFTGKGWLPSTTHQRCRREGTRSALMRYVCWALRSSFDVRYSAGAGPFAGAVNPNPNCGRRRDNSTTSRQVALGAPRRRRLPPLGLGLHGDGARYILHSVWFTSKIPKMNLFALGFLSSAQGLLRAFYSTTNERRQAEHNTAGEIKSRR